jgi:hypothetical protein
MCLLVLLDFNLIMLMQHLLAVTPVVGLLRENSKFTPTGNPAEVESIFDTPLEMFLKVQNGPFSLYYLCFELLPSYSGRSISRLTMEGNHFQASRGTFAQSCNPGCGS